MPNYCYNRLAIDGPDDELDKLAGAVANGASDDPDHRFSYAKIKPVADGEDTGEAWGATSLYCLSVERTKGELVYEWESAWDPPLAVVCHLAAEWPDLRFDYVYCEPGTERYGARWIHRGAGTFWSHDLGTSWYDQDGMREFLESYWPTLAEKWWDDDNASDSEEAA